MILPLASKIEEFKQLRVGHVQLHYGDDHGLDWLVPIQERHVKLTGVPLEFYGKAKLLWAGRLIDLVQFDFSRPPEKLPYPLNESDILRAEAEGGWFVFGDPQMTQQLLDRYKQG
jgi:hypothetical protein